MFIYSNDNLVIENDIAKNKSQIREHELSIIDNAVLMKTI